MTSRVQALRTAYEVMGRSSRVAWSDFSHGTYHVLSLPKQTVQTRLHELKVKTGCDIGRLTNRRTLADLGFRTLGGMSVNTVFKICPAGTSELEGFDTNAASLEISIVHGERFMHFRPVAYTALMHQVVMRERLAHPDAPVSSVLELIRLEEEYPEHMAMLADPDTGRRARTEEQEMIAQVMQAREGKQAGSWAEQQEYFLQETGMIR